MSMTSHSMILLSTRPQLIPGISLSPCICLSWRLSSPAAAVFVMVLSSVIRARCTGWGGFDSSFAVCILEVEAKRCHSLKASPNDRLTITPRSFGAVEVTLCRSQGPGDIGDSGRGNRSYSNAHNNIIIRCSYRHPQTLL